VEVVWLPPSIWYKEIGRGIKQFFIGNQFQSEEKGKEDFHIPKISSRRDGGARWERWKGLKTKEKSYGESRGDTGESPYGNHPSSLLHLRLLVTVMHSSLLS